MKTINIDGFDVKIPDNLVLSRTQDTARIQHPLYSPLEKETLEKVVEVAVSGVSGVSCPMKKPDTARTQEDTLISTDAITPMTFGVPGKTLLKDYIGNGVSGVSELCPNMERLKSYYSPVSGFLSGSRVLGWVRQLNADRELLAAKGRGRR